MRTRIRPATMADSLTITSFVRNFLADQPVYGQVLVLQGTGLDALIGLVLEQGAGVAFIAEREDHDGWIPVGMIAAVLGPHPVTGEGTVEELVWWMDPAHRRGRLGYQLLGSLEDWARQNGAVLLKMVAPVEPDWSCPVGDFYRRVGYTPIEVVHVKRL